MLLGEKGFVTREKGVSWLKEKDVLLRGEVNSHRGECNNRELLKGKIKGRIRKESNACLDWKISHVKEGEESYVTE